MTLFTNKTYNPKDGYSLPIERLRDYAKQLHKVYFASAEKYKKIYGVNDYRYRVFHEVVATANSLLIFFHLMDKYTESAVWWEKNEAFNVKNDFNNALVKDINVSLRGLLKFGHFHAIFMYMEDTLRMILYNIDSSACNNGKAEFKSIYDCLLTKLNLKQYITLLDISRCTRNSIHRNGVYVHKSKPNETFTYKGKTYTFKDGQAIDVFQWGYFDIWECFLDIFCEIDKMLNEIFDSTSVRSIADIRYR